MTVFASCEIPTVEPASPVLELSGEPCSIEYGENSYKASITNILQGITSITFNEPEETAGLVYTFSGNGCEIMFDDLSFKTEVSYMETNALPQVINEIFTDIRREDALTFTDSEAPKSSTLTTAVFNGKSSHFSYEVITDFDSGYIREIDIPDCDLIIKFAAK